MGTEYMELARPWSSMRETTNGHHTRVGYFVDGKFSGELVFGPEHEAERREAIRQAAGPTVAKVSAGPDGPELAWFKQPRTRTLVDEYGDITTVRNVESALLVRGEKEAS